MSNDTLSPPPIDLPDVFYFKDTKENKFYRVDFDGHKLGLNETSHLRFFLNEAHTHGFNWGCAGVLLLTFIFWYFVIKNVWRWIF